ncbi:hypothetical protein [Sphingomonas sp. DT-204]|uniref:hypothetical protein n=1 Tax=Sphingomonas sp. DT-204 TaxID=3396166 RepID=UPI003F1DC96E
MPGEAHESHTAAANIIDVAPRGYVEYEIDIERVLRTDLPGVLDQMAIAPLTEEAVMAIPPGAKGAYVLFENGHPVYAGKTDTRHGFRDRLTRHAGTIQHRHNLDPATIGFKAIRILVFSNFDVEAILIGALRKADATALRWNDTGFGSNDPGHRRETQEPADFDKQRPVDIDRPLGVTPGNYAPLELLIALKDGLPYTFRYQTDAVAPAPGKKRTSAHYRTGHADQRDAAPVTVNEGDSLRAILKKILAVLPAGWRVTVFPDRVILYAEPTEYEFAIEAFEK